MAEINVERKKNVWPWVVALIVILLAIWGAMALMNTDERRIYADPALGTTTEPVLSPTAQQPAITPADTATTGDAGDAAEDAPDRTTPPPPPQQ